MSILSLVISSAKHFSRLMIRDGIKGRIIQITQNQEKSGSKYNPGIVPQNLVVWG